MTKFQALQYKCVKYGAEAPKEHVLPLIKRRNLRIGWTECGIRERIDLVRCFRCLQYGHKTGECRAQADRSGDCIRCGESGHKGKECTNRNRCTTCNVDGHRADQIKCPEFKKMIEIARKQKMHPKEAKTRRRRGKTAHDLAYAMAKQRDVDMILVSEPNKTIVKRNDWIKDEKEDVAVLFMNKNDFAEYTEKVDEIALSVRSENKEAVIAGDINAKSFLWQSPVSDKRGSVRSENKEAVIAGDINAKSFLWQSPVSDKRGEYWAEWVAALDLVVHNTGEVATFARGTTESFIDVTLSTQKMSTRIIIQALEIVKNLSCKAAPTPTDSLMGRGTNGKIKTTMLGSEPSKTGTAQMSPILPIGSDS
ncbi:Endonuclease-reverse transcriptase [Popillia japonica]|uniref:Endonuclease-reverse transcriptase n=1 Tax=Popillia japonica TaxID=7064 RepID=A0AAW1JVZ8_POPJA